MTFPRPALMENSDTDMTCPSSPFPALSFPFPAPPTLHTVACEKERAPSPTISPIDPVPRGLLTLCPVAYRPCGARPKQEPTLGLTSDPRPNLVLYLGNAELALAARAQLALGRYSGTRSASLTCLTLSSCCRQLVSLCPSPTLSPIDPVPRAY